MFKSLLFIKFLLINSIKVLAYSNESLSSKENKINTNITSSNSFLKNFVVSKFSLSVKSFIVNILLPDFKFDFDIPFSEGKTFSSNPSSNNRRKKLVFPTPLPPNMYILFCSPLSYLLFIFSLFKIIFLFVKLIEVFFY